MRLLPAAGSQFVNVLVEQPEMMFYSIIVFTQITYIFGE
jgi:hypothetical protein